MFIQFQFFFCLSSLLFCQILWHWFFVSSLFMLSLSHQNNHIYY